jgi:hypothetical protein
MAAEATSSGLDSDEFRLWVKLEEIFMPRSRRQRDETYKRHGVVNAAQQLKCAHYTSAEAALSIIKSKRVWMRNTRCMSDHREVQHGIDFLKAFISDKAKIGAFVSAIDACAPGAAEETIRMFDSWLFDLKANTYISSMSAHDSKEDSHGRLSMWRAFRGGSSRVAIVFKIPWYSAAARALNLSFSPVGYLTEEDAQ